MHQRGIWAWLTAASLAASLIAVGIPAAAAPGPEPRIIGGSTVPDGKYPFVVALENLGAPFCGGSVIASTWVMTAAHCVTNSSGTVNIPLGNLHAIIGRYDLTTMAGEDIPAAGIVVHPMWDGESDGTFEYDVALIELSTPTSATPVELAAPADSGLWDAGDPATVMGWGATNPNGSGISDTLQEVVVPIVSDADCEAAWGAANINTAVELCAGSGTVDSCRGDSGGPLVAPPGVGTWKQVGIVSSGDLPCANPVTVGIYAEVAALRPFIDATLPTKPFASSLATTVLEDALSTISLFGFDAQGDTLTFTKVTDPADGSLSGITQLPPMMAEVDYTPSSDYFGPDAFIYKANDGAEDSDPATVSVTVLPVNDEPSFTKGANGTVLEDSGAQTVPGWATTISAGPPNEAGQTVTFAVTTNTNPALFSAAPSVSSGGTLTYGAAPNINGSATITLELRDDGGTANGGDDTSPAQSFAITVNPVNDPPIGVPDAYAVAAGGTLKVNGVLDNDTDVDGDPLTAVKLSDPTHGTLSLNPNGSFTYIHDGSETTSDSFAYVASDGIANSAPTTATINVSPTFETHYVGLVDPATGNWHLRNPLGAITTFSYGVPGDIPFMGDWDCDGTETPGLYRQSDGFAYIRNSNSGGVADISFFMGNPSDLPLAGDFDGDGCDTVSIYRPSEQRIYISNSLGTDGGSLVADLNYVFGNPGDKPFVGDFDGNGSETIGLHRESTGFVYFRNSHTFGNAHADYFFGNGGDRLVAGDWGIVDGTFTPAVFRPSLAKFFFRHTNTIGLADSEFFMGDGAWLPVSGALWP